MRIRSLAGLWLGRITKGLLRIGRRSGTSLPGLVAGKVAPNLLRELLSQLKISVIVTGTNGKTTTTALLYALINGEDKWLTNRGGANLHQGLLATMLDASNWIGKLQVTKAVLEVDEATLPKITSLYHPTVIVVTNVLRDQLDRYGEVDQTLRLLQQGSRYPGTTLIVNGDDPLAMSLGLDRPELTYYYGFIDAPEVASVRADVRDGAFCLICGQELIYDYFIYGQVGNYHCPNGHFARPEPHFGGRFDRMHKQLTVYEAALSPNEAYQIDSPVRGLFNQYNLLAAVSAVRVLGVSPTSLQKGILNFDAPTGRFEVFHGTPERILALVKNPTGANSVLRALEEDFTEKMVCFVINDDDADGRDVSWLWDINIDEFLPQSHCESWICAGSRGLDMALRLTYAGVDRMQILIIDKLSQIMDATAVSVHPVYILSTYTALHPLSTLLREGDKDD